MKPIPFDKISLNGNDIKFLQRNINHQAIIFLDESGQTHLIYGFLPYPVKLDTMQQGTQCKSGFWRVTLPTRQMEKDSFFMVEPADFFQEATDMETEALMAITHYQLPKQSPESTEDETTGYRRIYEESIKPNRLLTPQSDTPPADDPNTIRYDLRNRLIYTIDDEHAQDLDDAIEVKELEDGSYLLGVHIADVTAYVHSGSKRDLDALDRGTSHYLPRNTIHMLPQCLSGDLCSLLPDQDKLAVSVFMNIVPEGNSFRVVSSTVCRSVIRSRKKLSYIQVQGALEKYDAELGLELNRSLALAKKMAALLRPDQDAVNLAPPRHFLQDQPDNTSISRGIIERFMVTTNQTVGREIGNVLSTAGCTGAIAIFRIQQPPPEPDIQRYLKLLQQEGLLDSHHSYELFRKLATISVNARSDRAQLNPEEIDSAIRSGICHLIEREIESSDQETEWKQRVIQYIAGNSALLYRKAEIKSNIRNTYHHNMGITCYTWFTSPIRRYPDIVNHRQILALIEGKRYETDQIDIRKLNQKLKTQKQAQSLVQRRLWFAANLQNPELSQQSSIEIGIQGFGWLNPEEFEIRGQTESGVSLNFVFPRKPQVTISSNGLECRFAKLGYHLCVGERIRLPLPKPLGQLPPEPGCIVMGKRY